VAYKRQTDYLKLINEKGNQILTFDSLETFSDIQSVFNGSTCLFRIRNWDGGTVEVIRDKTTHTYISTALTLGLVWFKDNIAHGHAAASNFLDTSFEAHFEQTLVQAIVSKLLDWTAPSDFKGQKPQTDGAYHNQLFTTHPYTDILY